jgi:hypothetical protein
MSLVAAAEILSTVRMHNHIRLLKPAIMGSRELAREQEIIQSLLKQR